MSYKAFVQAATTQDKRNKFSVFTGDLTILPANISMFYINFNPEDVEMEFDGNLVYFVPAEKLLKYQQEYEYLNVDFVFATSNGDPIFLREGKVCTCPHGVREPDFELIAESFDDYLQKFCD